METWRGRIIRSLRKNNVKNKTLANWLVGSLSLCIVAGIIADENLTPALWGIAGLGIWVFGIWAIVRLYKTEDAPRHPPVNTKE